MIAAFVCGSYHPRLGVADSLEGRGRGGGGGDRRGIGYFGVSNYGVCYGGIDNCLTVE